jgi:glutathionyl-hydroquinone reductase
MSRSNGSFSCAGCIPDEAEHARTVRDLYDISHDTNGKYSVPVLWDEKVRSAPSDEQCSV